MSVWKEFPEKEKVHVPLVVLGEDQPILTSLLSEIAVEAGYDGLSAVNADQSPDDEVVRAVLDRAIAQGAPVFAIARDCSEAHAADVTRWAKEFSRLTRLADGHMGLPVHLLTLSDRHSGVLQPMHDLLFRRRHLHIALCRTAPQLRAQFLKRLPRWDDRLLSEVVPAGSRLFKFDTMTTDEHLLTWRMTSAIAKRGMNIIRARVFAWDSDAYLLFECETTRPMSSQEYESLEHDLQVIAPRQLGSITPYDLEGAPLEGRRPDITQFMRLTHSSFHSQPGVLKAVSHEVGVHRALLREVLIETPPWDPARNSLTATIDIGNLSADEVRDLRSAIDAIPALKKNPPEYEFFDAA